MGSQDGEDSWQGGGWRTRSARWRLEDEVGKVVAGRLGGPKFACR